MGVLTEATMRRREEMVALRRTRMALRGDLVRQTDERRTRVSVLCADFARDRAGAHRAWFGTTLPKRQAAERQQQRRLAAETVAKAQAERRSVATPKAAPQSNEPAKRVPAPAAPPSAAPLPQVAKASSKRSKKR